ncbi:hypothetical protein M3201_07715 [Paenibacillus motobuensis]|nr:hypothetical protein [Paenibacillus lutimineralis]MCM3646689.1 hypothetical protein [Paenibacillus motobuensis]
MMIFVVSIGTAFWKHSLKWAAVAKELSIADIGRLKISSAISIIPFRTAQEL